MQTPEQLQAIVGQFDTEGTISDIRPLGNGLINDTFRVKTAEEDAPDYVLQRINTNVFTDPNQLMNNIDAVTTHIRGKLLAQGVEDVDRRVLRFVKRKGSETTTSSPLLLEWPAANPLASGENNGGSTYWRLCVFIPRSISKEVVDAPNSRHAGEAFGDFQ